MTWDEWEEKYKPKLNHFHNDEDREVNGWMYETYGEEDEFIREYAQKHPNNVWTMMDCDDYDVCIGNGWHHVNRMGYFITELPFEDDDDIFVADEDDRREEEEEED